MQRHFMTLVKMIQSLFTSTPRPTPAEYSARLRAGEALLVDVREADEWRHGVAQDAVLLPLSDLTGAREQWEAFLAAATDREILLYCASGARSGMAARLLVREGFRAANTGGLADWAAADWPVVKPGRR
jgi:rhodanese-related sulfurtransferase